MAYSSTYPAFPPPAYYFTYSYPSPYHLQPNSYHYHGTVPLHTTPIDPNDNGLLTSTATYEYISTYTHENTPKTPKQQRRELIIYIIISLTIIGVFSVLGWWGSKYNERHKSITAR
jgi:hypothetical protein